MRFRDIPIQQKLMAVNLLTSGVVILLTCAAFVSYEFITLHRNMLSSNMTRAQIIAANSTASLAFQNQADATEVLGALKLDKRMMAASLYDSKGKLFAKYPADAPDSAFPAGPGESGYREGHLDIFAPVVQGDRTLGTVYIESNLSALTDRYRAYAWLALAIIVGSLLLAYLLSRALQGQIAGPILSLARTAKAVSQGDFFARADRYGDDEIGTLTDAFNQMLAKILGQDQALAERTRLLDQIMKSMSEGIVVAGLDGKMSYFNQATERIVGLGKSSEDFAHWTQEYGVFREDMVTPYPEVESPLVLALKGQDIDGAIQFVRNRSHPEGVFISVNARPLRDEKGNLTGGLVVVRDVTKERRANEALALSESNYREAVESVRDLAIVHLDLQGTIFAFNEGAENLKGYKKEEVLGKSFSMFYTAEEQKSGVPGRLLEQALKEGRIEKEGWRVRKDGTLFFADIFISLLKDESGKARGFVKIVRDITERKAMEDEIRRSNDFFNSVLENVPNMIFVKDAKDLRFVMFNRAGEELLGIPRAEMIGKNDYDFFPKPDADRFTSKDREVLKNGRVTDIPEETIETKALGQRVLHTKKFPIMGPEGQPLYLMGISEDVTESRRQQELKMYTQALEVSNRELQDFVFVASHDLQEPLRKVQSFGGFLKEEFQQVLGETGNGYVDRMRDAAGRMQRLINDLLALTRVTTKAQPFVPIELSNTLKDVLSDLETRIQEKKAKVEVSLLPRLEADETQMRQLFQNLIANALKFQKPGVPPEIRISASGFQKDGASSGSRCLITVEDNGIGFDNKYGEQIFKVFERLHGRDEYEGTGIGLAICRKVVERHGGSIKAEGILGKGSTFKIELPLQQKR